MPTPAETQQCLRRSIFMAPDAAVDRIVKGGALSPERRIGVHRNHFQISLSQALSATFPATQAVVGADFFEQTARQFALAHPPASPCLFEYGAEFPGYLDRLPALRELPYLGDLAGFEWAMNAAHHAPDHATLDPARLAALSAEAIASARFDMVPSMRLYASRFPILDIRRLARGEIAENVSLDAGGVHLLIHRRQDIVVWREIPQAEFVFLQALSDGKCLGEAISPDFDLAAALAAALRDGLFMDVSRNSPDFNMAMRVADYCPAFC